MSQAKLALVRELRLIQFALMFYTRLPVPSLPDVDQSTVDHASRYFPLIGWLIGGLSALSFIVFDVVFPLDIAVLLSMCFSIWLTGAFHEDGLADSCDGLGGGWDKQSILRIMKDSRVGTYGLVGLGSVLAIKFLALSSMSSALIPYALLVAHVTSRWFSSLFMYLMDYVRLDEVSKSKPITKGYTKKDFFIATALTVPVCFLLPMGGVAGILGALPLLVYFYRVLKMWLGGYTGDALGAVQQLAEVGCYLGLIASI